MSDESGTGERLEMTGKAYTVCHRCKEATRRLAFVIIDAQNRVIANVCSNCMRARLAKQDAFECPPQAVASGFNLRLEAPNTDLPATILLELPDDATPN